MNSYFRTVLKKQNFKDLEEAKTACKKGCDSDEACKFAALTNVPSSATCKFYDDKTNTCIFETVTHADANNHHVYVKSNANQLYLYIEYCKKILLITLSLTTPGLQGVRVRVLNKTHKT